jgi:hypothetical protein
VIFCLLFKIAILLASHALPTRPPLAVSARSAVESDKVSRLHARLSHAAQVAVQNAAAPLSAPSAAVHPAAAKPSSPDDDAIVAALKATLDSQEKSAEQKVVFHPLSPSPPFSVTTIS